MPESKQPKRIIDFRCRPPLPAYASLFQLHEMDLAPRTKDATFKGTSTLTPSMGLVGKEGALEQWWKEIDEAGVEIAVSNGRLPKDRGSIDADSLADLQKKYSGRFLGLAPVNLEQDMTLTVKESERAIRELRLAGFNLEPTLREKGGPIQVNHESLFPIYEIAVKHDVPIMIYTGPYAGPGWGDLMLANDMRPYDRAMQAFPKLKLVLGHGAYPNIVQVLGNAFKHANLYICADMYMFAPGGELYRNSLAELQNQFIFGSAYPFSSIKEPIEDTLRLGLSDQVIEKYMWGNAARLLKIENTARATAA
jgi:predicted TIM-barrel fold metal-dependent hydrolase